MGLLDDLGLVDAAKARPRGRCVRCAHTHDLANLATVVDAPYPYGSSDHLAGGGDALRPALVCRLGCPAPIGPHPALVIRSGQPAWAWSTSCDDLAS